MDIERKIKEVIFEQWPNDETDLKPETRFKEDLGLDDVDMIGIALEIEEKFNMNIPDQDLEKFLIIDDLVKYVRERRGGNKP